MNTPETSTIQKPFSSVDRQSGRHPLDSIFVPKSVAVVGATEKVGSVGRTVLWNLMNTPFGGPIYPVNPTRPSVLGIKAYPKLANLPEKPDLVVVTTPAAIIPGIIGEAADLGIPGAVVISAGFKETGPGGSGTRAAVAGPCPARQHAARRPELSGRDEPHQRRQRDLCRRHRAPGQRRLHQPVRRPLHRRARLVAAGNGRLQRVRVHRLDARRGLGRPHQLLWR